MHGDASDSMIRDEQGNAGLMHKTWTIQKRRDSRLTISKAHRARQQSHTGSTHGCVHGSDAGCVLFFVAGVVLTTYSGITTSIETTKNKEQRTLR